MEAKVFELRFSWSSKGDSTVPTILIKEEPLFEASKKERDQKNKEKLDKLSSSF